MPTQEITLVVEVDQDLDKEAIEVLGRNAALGILEHSGTRAYGVSHSLAESVRFLGYKWYSQRYMGPDEDRDWAITQAEIEVWDEREAEDDDW